MTELEAAREQIRALIAECGALTKQLAAAKENNYRLRQQLAAQPKLRPDKPDEDGKDVAER